MLYIQNFGQATTVAGLESKIIVVDEGSLPNMMLKQVAYVVRHLEAH